MAVTFAFVASISNEARDANAKIVKTLGLPYHKGSGRLAIVGGGPSIRHHVDELRTWDGEVWAVNGTINWCLAHEIKAAFYTIDAAPMENWTYPLHNVRRAVMSEDCNPEVVKYLCERASVSLLPTPDGGPTSAAAADLLAMEAGYYPITWFGCESSFEESTHAFESFPVDAWIVVRVGGKDYRTKPEFLAQAEIISEVIRQFPQWYSEKSGGLLRAMVEHRQEYELIECSDAVLSMLRDAA